MNVVLRSHRDQYFGPFPDASGIEMLGLTYLRLWADGPLGRDRVTREICDTVGAPRGQRIVQLWAELLDTYRRYQPHNRDEPGFNDACFASFLAIAAEGDREEALILATSLVRPDAVLILTNLATQIGLSFKQILLIRSAAGRSLSQKLH